MQGTVFGDMLVNLFSARLAKIAKRAYSKYRITKAKGMIPIPTIDDALYGMYAYYQRGAPVRVSIDGGCGMSSVERIADAIGVRITKMSGDRRGDNRVWSVSWWE